ncbi:MAG: type I pullulanase [Halanaerobiaceae bacterium]
MVVKDRKLLKLNHIDYYYPGKDLGVISRKRRTIFRIWAPVAEKVKVFIFDTEDRPKSGESYYLNKDIKGTWKLEIDKNLEGKYYLYRIYYQNKYFDTVDPYAKAVGTNSKAGLIVNLEKTNPDEWEKDQRIKLGSPVDAVIYEMHVRDFSTSRHSGMKNKGKYLAFTEDATTNSEGYKTGIEHLKELGITHVHLLPIFDFASVNDKNNQDYNWGYDPYYYNTPEGSYASNPSDDSRIKELKKLVKKLHDNNIGVIMDVVYNHTYYTRRSCFQLTAPGYFYRTFNCDFANGSGCGNEIATERPMVRKFIVDSITYWAREYHLDGFRFDLMGLIDRETMRQIEKILHNIDSSILIYGEPWYALPPSLDSSKQIFKGAQKGMNIAVFNDHFREAIKGDNDNSGRGFVSGAPHRERAIKQGVVGGIEYNQEIRDFTSTPEEVVNYVSSHDNLTLWDKFQVSNPEDPEKMRIKMDRMAQAIIFTSQGIPFIQGGEEFLRTKYKNHNSFNAGDEINQLKWERKSRYYKTFKYYQGLIKLRKEHPAFRMNNARQIRKHLEFIQSPANTVGFKLDGHANGDKWETIVVLYNPNKDWAHFRCKEKKRWNIVVDDEKAGTTPFNTFIADNVNVPPISVMVLYG